MRTLYMENSKQKKLEYTNALLSVTQYKQKETFFSFFLASNHLIPRNVYRLNFYELYAYLVMPRFLDNDSPEIVPQQTIHYTE